MSVATDAAWHNPVLRVCGDVLCHELSIPVSHH